MKKRKYILLLATVCKQIIGKAEDVEFTYCCLFIEKLFSFGVPSFFIICYASCQCHDKVENALTCALLEL